VTAARHRVHAGVLASRAMRHAWLVLSLCACKGDAPPPAPVPATAPRDAAAAADAWDVAVAKAEAEHRRIQHDIDAFEAEVNDPANRGSNWRKVLPAGSDVDLWGIYADGSDVIAVGHDAMIVRSQDAGSSWHVIQPGPLGFDDPLSHGKPLIARVTGEGTRRLAIGFENSLVGISNDGGETWERVTFDAPTGAIEVDGKAEPTGAVLSGSDLYISDVAVVHISHDGGATWKDAKLSIARDDSDNREGIHGLAGSPDGRDVYVYGRSHAKPWLAATHDRGRSWQPVASAAQRPNAAFLMDVAVAPDHTVLAQFGSADAPDGGARDAALSISHDGGASWTVQPIAYVGNPDEVNDKTRWWSPGPWWVAPEGAIYAAYSGRDTMGMQVSADRGKTWRRELGFTPMTVALTRTAVYAVGHHADVWIKKLAP
jgi:photosystem II stability/assembly factor-like uncharacterized protein